MPRSATPGAREAPIIAQNGTATYRGTFPATVNRKPAFCRSAAGNDWRGMAPPGQPGRKPPGHPKKGRPEKTKPPRAGAGTARTTKGGGAGPDRHREGDGV